VNDLLKYKFKGFSFVESTILTGLIADTKRYTVTVAEFSGMKFVILYELTKK